MINTGLRFAPAQFSSTQKTQRECNPKSAVKKEASFGFNAEFLKTACDFDDALINKVKIDGPERRALSNYAIQTFERVQADLAKVADWDHDLRNKLKSSSAYWIKRFDALQLKSPQQMIQELQAKLAKVKEWDKVKRNKLENDINFWKNWQNTSASV